MPRVRYSPAVQEVSGKLGRDVYLHTPSGPALRSTPHYRYPFQPIQREAQTRLRAASAAYGRLTPQQAAAWDEYARTLTRTGDLSGEEYNPTAQNAFVGLALKLLQIDPDATLPAEPPATSFGGDAVAVRVEGEAGAVVFSASGPNAPGVLTELLVQPLKSAVRKPGKFYRSAAFVAFQSAESAAVEMKPGWVACAVRFVEASSGRVTPLLPLGVVQIS